MQLGLTFDDVLIQPNFSTIESRGQVSLSTQVSNGFTTIYSDLPVIAANMDTICGQEMAKTMNQLGALACLHRFWPIEANIAAFLDSGKTAWCSVGIGRHEFSRAMHLFAAGCRVFILDVAHGAQAQVAQQYRDLKQAFPEAFVIVGNFATARSIQDFYYYLIRDLDFSGKIDGIKIGVGPGSACTTRIKTGCGMPQLEAILSCKRSLIGASLIIADGGCRTPGDIAKALAAGADLVMLGGMLAGTAETPGDLLGIRAFGDGDYERKDYGKAFKEYRGSASNESYAAQGKDQSYITAEGESFTVPYKGPVQQVLKDIEGGLRSALTYVGARNLQEFRERVQLIQITNAGSVEGTAHGKLNV